MTADTFITIAVTALGIISVAIIFFSLLCLKVVDSDGDWSDI